MRTLLQSVLAGSALMLVIAVSIGCGAIRGGVLVTVRNSQQAILQNVTVRVGDRDYDIGDLKPGEAQSVTVQPTGESHVVIVTRADGAPPVETKVDTYMEQGYGGTLDVEFLASGDVKVVDHVRP